MEIGRLWVAEMVGTDRFQFGFCKRELYSSKINLFLEFLNPSLSSSGKVPPTGLCWYLKPCLVLNSEFFSVDFAFFCWGRGRNPLGSCKTAEGIHLTTKLTGTISGNGVTTGILLVRSLDGFKH